MYVCIHANELNIKRDACGISHVSLYCILLDSQKYMFHVNTSSDSVTEHICIIQWTLVAFPLRTPHLGQYNQRTHMSRGLEGMWSGRGNVQF